MALLTIGHISDLHISCDCCGRSAYRSEMLIDHLVSKGVDHIIVTGDITSTGSRKDFDRARALFEKCGILRSDRLSLVIGNHDIFGGVTTAEEILDFPSRLKRADHPKKIEEFRRYFSEAFEDCLFGSREIAFPYAKIVGHAALIGMNSVAQYSPVTNPLGSNGIVSRAERKRSERMLSSPALDGFLKIVLIHHHFSSPKSVFEGTLQGVWRTVERETLRLRKKQSLLRMFKECGVRLVLHGHLHESGDYRHNGTWYVNSGASLIGKDPRTLSAHVIRLRDQEIRLETIILSQPATGRAGSSLRLLHHHTIDSAA